MQLKYKSQSTPSYGNNFTSKPFLNASVPGVLAFFSSKGYHLFPGRRNPGLEIRHRLSLSTASAACYNVRENIINQQLKNNLESL